MTRKKQLNRESVLGLFFLVSSLATLFACGIIAIFGGGKIIWTTTIFLYAINVVLPWVMIQKENHDSRGFIPFLTIFGFCLVAPFIVFPSVLFGLFRKKKSTSRFLRKVAPSALRSRGPKSVLFILGETVSFIHPTDGKIKGMIGHIGKRNVVVIREEGEAWTVPLEILKKVRKRSKTSKMPTKPGKLQLVPNSIKSVPTPVKKNRK